MSEKYQSLDKLELNEEALKAYFKYMTKKFYESEGPSPKFWSLRTTNYVQDELRKSAFVGLWLETSGGNIDDQMIEERMCDLAGILIGLNLLEKERAEIDYRELKFKETYRKLVGDYHEEDEYVEHFRASMYMRK